MNLKELYADDPTISQGSDGDWYHRPNRSVAKLLFLLFSLALLALGAWLIHPPLSRWARGERATARVVEILREHRLSRQVFARWRQEFLERAPEIFATEQSRGDEHERIAELERMVGRLAMELEVSKKASSILTSLSNGRGS